MLHKLNSDLLSLIVNYLNFTDFSVIEKCIKLNDIVLSRYLKISNISFSNASLYGFLKLVKYMYKNQNQNRISNQEKEDAIDFACEHGYIRLVKYLHQIVKAECSEYALNYASSNGNFEVVKYLCEIIGVKSDNLDYSIYLANFYHKQHVLQYLQSIKNTLK